nr:hypothetical protein [Tanacetum cinerariifolium]
MDKNCWNGHYPFGGNSDFLCHNYVLSGLVDSLYNVYCKTTTAKELWESLERKYKTEDVSIKKFVVACFLDYKMVDSKNVITHVQDLQVLLHDIHAERMTLSETFKLPAIIEKLPPRWVEFKNYFKHKRKEISVKDLANMVEHVESSSKSNYKGKDKDKRKNDKRSKGKAEYLPPKVGIVKQKFQVTCYNCDRPGHRAANCKMSKPVTPRHANMVNDNMDMIAMVSDVITMMLEVNLVGSNNSAVDNGEKLYMGNSAIDDIKGEGDVIFGDSSSRIDDEVVQDQRQRDDNDLQDERQDRTNKEKVEPRRSKKARTEKSPGPDFVSFMVKDKQEKDKIGSKPDKNGKRGEAGKSQKQLQSREQEKLKKMQVEGPKFQTPTKLYYKERKKGAENAIISKYKERGQNCQHSKAVKHKDQGSVNVYVFTFLYSFLNFVDENTIPFFFSSSKLVPSFSSIRQFSTSLGKRPGFSPCRWCTCERCGVDLRDRICPLCNSMNSCAYDPNPNSFDFLPDSYHPSYPTYETYSGDTCENDSQFGYDCPPQFPLNYEPEPGYTQNYNSCPHDSPSFPQQYLCCDDYGVTHESYQCQPMNKDYYHEQNSCYNSNSFGFDDCQPPQYTVNHPIFNTHLDYLDSQNELSTTITKLKEQMTSLTSFCGIACQIVQKKHEEKRIEEEQVAKAQNQKLPICYDDDDDEEESNSLKDNIISELPPCSAVTPESDEFIKSCIENLVPNPSESEGENGCDVPSCFTTFSNILFDADYDFKSVDELGEFIKSCVENLVPNPSDSEGENGCNVPACFTTLSNTLFDDDYEFDSVDDQSLSDEDFPEKIFLNPLFEEEIISMKIDQHHFNAKLILFSMSSPILLYDNSSPRPPKEFVSDNFDVETESFSPSYIPVKDSDSLMEEIDLSYTPDDPMPSGIEEDDDDSGRDILIREELLDNYSLSLLVIESLYFDIPSFSCPPAKPPDGNTGILNIKIMGYNSKQKVPIPELTITRVSNQEKSPDLFSHRGLEIFQPSAKCPMMIHGKNIPILYVPLFHFYPLISSSMGELGQAQRTKTSASWEAPYSFQ